MSSNVYIVVTQDQNTRIVKCGVVASEILTKHQSIFQPDDFIINTDDTILEFAANNPEAYLLLFAIKSSTLAKFSDVLETDIVLNVFLKE